MLRITRLSAVDILEQKIGEVRLEMEGVSVFVKLLRGAAL